MGAIDGGVPVREALRRRAEANLGEAWRGGGARARGEREAAIADEVARLGARVMAELSRRIDEAERRLLDAVTQEHIAALPRRAARQADESVEAMAPIVPARAASTPVSGSVAR